MFQQQLGLHLVNYVKKLRKKYKVILTGTGGDEMFAGYYIHQLHYLFSIKYSKNFNKKYEEWQKKLVPLLRNNFLRNYKLYEKN